MSIHDMDSEANKWSDLRIIKNNEKEKLQERIAELETAKDNYKYSADQLRNIADRNAVANETLRKRIAELEAQRDELLDALKTICDWKDFPETGAVRDDGSPQYYSTLYGSNGERDYMRSVAESAIKKARGEA